MVLPPEYGIATSVFALLAMTCFIYTLKKA